MMNDLEKAKQLIQNKNVVLTELSVKTDIPVQTLKNLRYDLSQLDKSSWKRVHLLAEIYDTEIKRIDLDDED